MEWVYLILAILLELAGTVSMKLSNGLTRLVPSLLIVAFYVPSFALVTLSLKTLDIGLVYAIWSGVGTAIIAAIGILYFHEPVTVIKLVSLGLIIAGVIGLNLSGASR
jgi:small multidrug resistance pump